MARGKRVKKNKNAGLTVGITVAALAVLVVAIIGVYEVFFKKIAPEPVNTDTEPTVNTEPDKQEQKTDPAPAAETKYAVPASIKLSDGTTLELGASGEMTEKEVRELVKAAAEKVKVEPVSAASEVGEKTVTLTKGKDGAALDEESAVAAITGKSTAGAAVETVAAEDIDLDALYASIHADGTAEEPGVTFDLEAAKEAYAALAPGESMEIELLECVGGYTDADFPDVLCEKSTSMKTSSANRITNITLAAQAIDGLVLKPGDVFSYNGVVGQRTAAKGYKPAGAYVGGETVDEIGGGICQVSSTLYWCALKSDLKIVSRANHMYPVAYLPLGFDATVNWGTIDFKFENSLSNPIRLRLRVENKELFVTIEGTKETDNTFELKYVTKETIDWTTEYKIDETLEPGTTKEKQAGQVGYVIDTFKIVKDAEGKKLSETKLATNKYRAHTNIILCAPDAYEKIMAELNGTPLPEEPVEDPNENPENDPAENPTENPEETPTEAPPEDPTDAPEEEPKIPVSGANLTPAA